MERVSIFELNTRDVYFVRAKINWQTIQFIATYMGLEIQWGHTSYLFKYINHKFRYLSINWYGAVIRKKTNARKKYLIKIFESILDKDFAIMNADYV